MESNESLRTPRIIIAIFSDANFLALNILENLVSKNCYVYIVTNDFSRWIERTSKINVKSKFLIVEQNNFSENFQYSLIISGYIQGEPYNYINFIFNKYSFLSSKNLIIIPSDKYDFEKSKNLRVPENIGILYTTDLLGSRMDMESDLNISRKVVGSYYERTFSPSVGEIFYPTFVSDVAKNISRWIFSFGPFGKEEILLGHQISATDFWKEIEKVSPGTTLSYNERLLVNNYPKSVSVKLLDIDLKLALTETLNWLNKNEAPVFKKNETKKDLSKLNNFFKKVPKGTHQDKPPKISPKNDKLSKKPKMNFLVPLSTSVLFFLFLPFVLLMVVFLLDFFAYKNFIGSKDNNAQNLLLIGKTISVVSEEESSGLSLIPFLGRIYKESEFASHVSATFSDVSISAIPVVRNSTILLNNVLGNKIYDPLPLAQEIKTGLVSLHQKISDVQYYTNKSENQNLFVKKILLGKIDLESLANITLQGETIADRLPEILGKGGPKTYLVLFQNNMELRPTGGFIGSFGLLTFDSGRITDLIVNDVYSADGQLNGHVEPPLPIKNYLGEANWWLRDSNWDPDFPTSAKRAEWFLDKEIGKEVDGVVAIDLDPIKRILKLTGPVFLSDYNLSISSDNLYEKTQSEVQDNFFPGTHKKASFLTALSRNLLSEIGSLNPTQRVGFLKSFYSDLIERHVQVFVHDEFVQLALSGLGWSGEVGIPNCGTSCYSDLVGIVEANVGVNKANYFIARSVNLDVSIDSNKIKRTLTVNIKNSSNGALGPSGRYKVYIRALTNINSKVLGVSVVTGETAQPINPEITELKSWQEVGGLVEVLSGQTKSVVFSWVDNIDLKDKNGLYGLYMRKEAGVDPYPFTLTVNGQRVYNGQVSQDYFNRLDISK